MMTLLYCLLVIFVTSCSISAAILPVNQIKKVVHQAVRAAGGSIVDNFNTIGYNNVESKIGSRDIVTKTDQECQEIVKKIILEEFPTHKFLGEEDVAPGRDASIEAIKSYVNEDNLWIVDPIDGTTNFAHGIPLCGIIIAYASKGELLYGCIYDPFRNELFDAYKNQGAYLNGKRITCCKTNELKQSVVCTGSPPNFKSLEACLRATNLISSEVRTMRMFGSAAIMLSWIACGRVTAYFEADLNVWDLAAGCLIIQEAGGKCTDVWGNNYALNTRNIVASNGIIHTKLVERLMAAEMWMQP